MKNPLFELCLAIGLKCALAVALVEALIFFYGGPVEVVLIGGWIFVFGYTSYRVWRLDRQSLLANDINFASLVGSIFCIGITSVILYLMLFASYNPASNSIWQIKAAFISNPFAALGLAAFATIGTFVTDQIRSIMDHFNQR